MRSQVLLIAYVLLTHGIALFNQGVFWDDWVTYPNLILNDLDTVRQIYSDSGRPTYFYIHLLPTIFENILFGYRLIFVVATMLAAYSTYQFCQYVNLEITKSWLIAALTTSFPAFLVGFEIVLLPNVIDYALFMCANWIFVATICNTSSTTAKFKFYSLRIIGMILYVISFDTNSLLVYFYPFLILFFFKSVKNINHFCVTLKQVANCMKYFLFALLPVIWWIINYYYFPVTALYVSYNKFDISKLAVNSLIFVLFGGVIPIIESITIPLRLPLLFLVFIVIVVLMVLLKFNLNPLNTNLDQTKLTNTWGILLFGFILLIAGVFPYLAVGKFPIYRAWETRHAILIGLPISLITVGSIQILYSKVGFKYHKFIQTCVFGLLIMFSARHIENYLMWQARWIKDAAFMVNLSRNSVASQFTTYYIQDEWLTEDNSLLYKYDSEYEFYEYSGMFRMIWGDQTRIGFDLKAEDWREQQQLVAQDIRYRTKEYNLANFDPTQQCSTTFVISKLDKRSDMRIALDYITNQLLDPDINLKQLPMLSKIEVIPDPNNNCQP